MARTRHHLDEAAIRLSTPADSIMVLGDRGELHTAFSNLLDNAVKYSDGTPKIAVKLRSSATGRAEIYFRDNGVGIPAADLKRIFKRFYRVVGRRCKGHRPRPFDRAFDHRETRRPSHRREQRRGKEAHFL